jgi:hypothetical protein
VKQAHAIADEENNQNQTIAIEGKNQDQEITAGG